MKRTATPRRSARWPLAFALPWLLCAPAAGASTAVERLSERGPATLIVGVLFTVSALPTAAVSAASGKPVAIQACRFGHGIKMVAAGAVLFPAGLLAMPFNWRRAPGGWMDGLMDAFQEDYCARPPTSVYP